MNIYPLENGLVEWIIRYPQMLNIPLKIICKTAVQLCLGPQECLISIKSGGLITKLKARRNSSLFYVITMTVKELN